MRNLTILFTLLMPCLVPAADLPKLTATQMAVVDAHIRQVGGLGVVSPDSINAMAVSAPAAGRIALVLLYVQDNAAFSDVKEYRLAVFLKVRSGLSTPIELQVGEAGRQDVSLREVTQDHIVLHTAFYAAPEPDYSRPYISRDVTYVIKNNALVEARSPNPSLERP